MTYTLTDLFCGAGGSSSGAERVPGVQVRMAANHWDLAIETHNTNLPHADHDCADISQVDPRRYPATDLLWASPECTNHSQAKGKKRLQQPDLFGDTLPDAAAERSRATMWDVPRFLEQGWLRGRPYKAFFVENVVDVRAWMFYDSWRHAISNADYCTHEVSLNSMHAQGGGMGAPQSRDRWYLIGHLKKIACPNLDEWVRPLAWCPSCDEVVRARQTWKNGKTAGKYRAQYVFTCPKLSCRGIVIEPPVLPAAAAIDWTLAGQRIGDRDKPLAEKTIRRIEAGLRKYSRPIHLEAAGHTYDAADPKHPQHGQPGAYMRAWDALTEPLKTLHTIESKGVAYAPLMVPVEGREGKQARSVEQPLRTQSTRNETGVCVPPFIAELRGGGSETRPVSDPLATVTASGNHHGLITTYYGNGGIKSTAEPLPTATTRDTHALVMRNNTARGDQGQMSTPVGEPLRTLTTAGHQSLIEWSVPDVEDCYFRMLEPHEIKVAMAFADDYVLLGNKREQVKLAGNAVTPCAARDLISSMVEAMND